MAVAGELTCSTLNRVEGARLVVGPKEIEASVVNDRRDAAAGDLHVDLLPRRPDGSLFNVARARDEGFARAVIEDRRICTGSAEEVKNVGGCVAVLMNVVIHTRDGQCRQLFETLEVF